MSPYREPPEAPRRRWSVGLTANGDLRFCAGGLCLFLAAFAAAATIAWVSEGWTPPVTRTVYALGAWALLPLALVVRVRRDGGEP